MTIVLSVNEHSTINGKRYRYNKRSNFIVHVGEHLSYDAGAFDDATKKPFAVEAMAFTLIASARTIPMPAKPYMKGFWTGHSRSRRD